MWESKKQGQILLLAAILMLLPCLASCGSSGGGGGTAPAGGGPAAAPPLVMASVSDAGAVGNAVSVNAVMDATATVTVFESSATNLVPGDSNGVNDIFVHTRITGQTTRVSVGPSGVQADGDSFFPSISDDGRFVAFESDATNLVVGDTNLSSDIFVHDITTGQARRVSISSAGGQADGSSFAASISQTGRFVLFQSNATNLLVGDTNGLSDIFVHDRDTDGDGLFNEPGAIATTRVSVSSVGVEANGASFAPAITPDGRFVVFASDATNLVIGDTNSVTDIFVHDRQTGQTVRVSVRGDGAQADGPGNFPSISSDGRFVAFESTATNLVTGDTNGVSDIFVHDRDADENGIFDEAGGILTVRVSVGAAGVEADGASNMGSGTALNRDGDKVVFLSAATNLVNSDFNNITDVFVHRLSSSTTSLVSVDASGNQANNVSTQAAISRDGQFIAFSSNASNLVTGDTNGVGDAFISATP